VTVIWNGTVVTGPVLIYQDEITEYPGAIPSLSSLDDPGSHTLFCRSATSARVAWHLADVDGTKTIQMLSIKEEQAQECFLVNLYLCVIDTEQCQVLAIMDCGHVN
jgi:hypothetical protein